MANIAFTEAGELNNSIFGKSQAPIRRIIEKRAEALERDSVVNKIFDVNSSKNYSEKVTSMTATEGPKPVGEMGAHPWDGMREGFSREFEHEVWKDRMVISREMIDDARAVNLRRQPEAFVAGYHRARERFGAMLMGSGLSGYTKVNYSGRHFSTACADGQALFSTAHLCADNSATISNAFADDFSVDALSAVETAMQNFVGDSGEELDIAPDTIIIPNDWELKKAVFAVIGADRDPATANNGFNYQFGSWNVIVWQYLNRYVASGTHPWILMDSSYNFHVGGALWFDRVALEISSWLDRDTNANGWDMDARFSAGFADFRAFAAGGISGATQLLA